jgi:hypothetical protein
MVIERRNGPTRSEERRPLPHPSCFFLTLSQSPGCTDSVNKGLRGMMVGVETTWLFKNSRRPRTDTKTMNNSSGITIHVRFSAFVPLLPKYCLAKTTHSKAGETNLVAHEVLCPRSAHIVLFKVTPPYLHFLAPEKSS